MRAGNKCRRLEIEAQSTPERIYPFHPHSEAKKAGVRQYRAETLSGRTELTWRLEIDLLPESAVRLFRANERCRNNAKET
jgi:hypothetical protein